jgi:predicted transcriptional regulator
VPTGEKTPLKVITEGHWAVGGANVTFESWHQSRLQRAVLFIDKVWSRAEYKERYNGFGINWYQIWFKFNPKPKVRKHL